MVKITIVGDEGVPVQVDGEAWVQPPGLLKIVHKNRAQMLVRDKVRPTKKIVCLSSTTFLVGAGVGVLLLLFVCFFFFLRFFFRSKLNLHGIITS